MPKTLTFGKHLGILSKPLLWRKGVRGMERLRFEVLSSLAEQRDISLLAEVFGWTAEALEQAEKDLEAEGLLQAGSVTEEGLKALEPYRVRRAVFLAAGFGSRMVPITLNTPKPLVRVHGKRIIETIIDAVLAAGIEEIWIVRGYLGENFELLQKKYPQIRLIENPEYDGTGTISSFYYARNLLEGAYVLESDLVVSNPKVIRRYHYSSDFLGTKVDETDDWFFRADDEGTISEIGVGGSGKNLYKLIGISFWSPEDGRKLASDIEEAYWGPGGKKLPMSFIPFRVYRESYRVSIMPCRETDVVEIDSFKELQAFDEAYRIN